MPIDDTFDNLLDRLINWNNSAEGSTVPPRVVGDARVPPVTNLVISNTQPIIGGSLFTLTWLNADVGADGQIAYYNIYALGLNNNDAQELNVVTVHESPASISVQASHVTPIRFVVQTVLTSGLVSDIKSSPTVSGVIKFPTLIAPAAQVLQGYIQIINWDGGAGLLAVYQ